ncbi:MAG TPA: protein kinase [Vicinamibacterales bacterium]|nr:protein kinase [Vicinamibacterales bacterium]
MTFAAGTEPRYRIVETIGRGGMGEVCLADDVMLHRQVALKFLATPGESGGLEQLLGEARAAAALDHPFICSIYEVTALDGRHCIAMEYVRGESLERRLRRGPLRVGDALRVAEEIAEALDAAHRRRVIHRDLKPANVMLTEDGHIKVMDFGLAARLPLTDVSDQTVDLSPAPALVRGTPAYMAPEQFRGEPADRRSDIFAFGVLLYEVLSGANPFRRVGIDATIAAVLGEPATQLRDVPPALEALLARLLAKDPAARHQSFTVVRNALRRCSVETTPSATLPPPAVDRAPGEGRARLTGRDSELTQLLNCLRQGRSGSGSLVFLFGEAGIGKTRLAEEALSAARQLGYQTLVGRCYEQDDRPVLIPFIEILEEASRLMPVSLFHQAVGASAPELARLMPQLHRLFPDMAPPLELPPQLQQRFLFTNVREFLTRSGRSMPLALFVDDLQWADEATLQLTQHLATHLANLPIVLIAAYREIDPPAAAASKGRFQSLLDRVRGQARTGHTRQPVKATLDQLVAQRQAQAIVLRPLEPADVRNVLATLGPPDPPVRLVRTITEHTGGNPLFIVELFRHLKEEGRLFDARQQWARTVDLDEVTLPDTVRLVLERRMRRVSADVQNVLSAAAVIGQRFEPDLVEAVAEVDGDRLASALHDAERARILKGPSGRREVSWRFDHRMTCQLLMSAIPQTRQQRLHLRAADAMTRLAAESRLYTSAIAHHLYCAGPLADPARTAEALIAAGDAAHAVYATEEAAQHYRRALEVLQDTSGHERARRAVQETLADLLAMLGDRQAAMEHYARVANDFAAAGAVVDEARIARKTGALHWQAGDRPAAMDAYRRALQTLSGLDAHIEAAHLYQELGLAAFRSGDNHQATEWATRALASAEQALAATPADTSANGRAATAAIAHATNTIGVALARTGKLDAAREHIERSLAAAQRLGLLDVACRAYANLGVLYSSVEPKRAIDISLTGLEIASRIGAASLQSYIYANLASAYCALTDRCETEGLQAASAAAALDRELGQLDHLAVPLVVMAQIHQCSGQLQKADEAYREALSLAEKIGEPQLILPCYDGLATIHLDRGDRVRAEEYMEKARQLCERTGLDPDTLLLLPFLC